MKKLLLVVFLLFPFFTYAASGGCSDHSGVNCSAGAGIYGQAICNDGWTGSSVSYYSMSECVATPSVSSCLPPITANLCTGAPNYVASCGYSSQYTSDMYALCRADCQSKESAYQSQAAIYNSCLAQQQQTQQTNIQNQQRQQAQEKNIQDMEQQLTQATQQWQEASDLKLKNSCQKLMGPYSEYDGTQAGYLDTSCVCQSGYSLDASNSQCELPATVCSNTLGQYSHPVPNGCVCNDGYIATAGKCLTTQEDAKKILDQVIASSSHRIAAKPAVTTAPSTTLKGFFVGAKPPLGGGFLDTAKPPTPQQSQQALRVFNLKNVSDASAKASASANSFGGLLKNTITGIPDKVYGFFGLFGLH